MERKLNIKVLLPEDVIEKYDIDEDTGVLSYDDNGNQPRTGDCKEIIQRGKQKKCKNSISTRRICGLRQSCGSGI